MDSCGRRRELSENTIMGAENYEREWDYGREWRIRAEAGNYLRGLDYERSRK